MRIPLPKAKRYLARKVIYGGKEYGLSTVELNAGRIILQPFEKETPSTVYVDGAIIVEEEGESGFVLLQDV